MACQLCVLSLQLPGVPLGSTPPPGQTCLWDSPPRGCLSSPGTCPHSTWEKPQCVWEGVDPTPWVLPCPCMQRRCPCQGWGGSATLVSGVSSTLDGHVLAIAIASALGRMPRLLRGLGEVTLISLSLGLSTVAADGGQGGAGCCHRGAVLCPAFAFQVRRTKGSQERQAWGPVGLGGLSWRARSICCARLSQEQGSGLSQSSSLPAPACSVRAGG